MAEKNASLLLRSPDEDLEFGAFVWARDRVAPRLFRRLDELLHSNHVCLFLFFFCFWRRGRRWSKMLICFQGRI